METTLARKDIIASKTDEIITIDARPDKPCWGEALELDGFYTNLNGRIIPAASRTGVRTLWNKKYLYIRAEMEDQDICAQHLEKNSRTWEDDAFEIFIKPAEDKTHYYEFHVTPNNVTLELFFPRRRMRGGYRSMIFDSGIKTAVDIRGELNNWRVKDEGWTAEIAIPFTAFSETSGPPDAGSIWKAAFCRYDYSYYLPESYGAANELSSSAPLSEWNFHLHEDYNRLIFTEK